MRIVSVVFLSIFFGCSIDIYTGLDEAEANRLLVEMSENGIKASKEVMMSDTGAKWSVRVKKGDFARALAILEKNKLPRIRDKGVLEIFGKSGFLPTQTAERALEAYSLNAELAKTIEEIQGVVSARVHVIRNNDGFSEQRPEHTSASVLVNYIPEEDNGMPFSIEDIKKLIAGGVSGLSEDDVRVVAMQVRQRHGTEKKKKEGRNVLPLVLAPFLLLSGGLNILLWRRSRILRNVEKNEPIGPE